MPGTLPTTVSTIFVTPSPGWNVTVADVCSSSGGVPALARPLDSAIEKHDACAAAISSSGLVLPPVASSERAAQLTGSSPNAPLVVERIVPLPSIKLPFQITSARRSVAMSLLLCRKCRKSGLSHYLDGRSVRRAALFEIQDYPQRADRDLELVERRLARRQALEPQTGREQRHQHTVALVLAGEPDQLVREPGDQRQEQDPLGDQPVPVRPAEEREDEHGEHHHPEQKRRAAARMDERVALHGLRRELLSCLVRVDGLVLGRVVLEDAPQIRQQRDQPEIADKQRDANRAFDDHEPGAALDRQQPGYETRRDLEERDRKADCDHEREDERTARELDVVLVLLLPFRLLLLRRAVRRHRDRTQADRAPLSV